ncbi:hypothetical protein IFR05_011343 [Cadophora sp. M221]|nr:hypothetical protein IFR05_011343 [Cadophora sp. M221]
MASNYKIATGRWENYSNKGWLAASLTLDVQTGAILIAATATFITIVGARFWTILSFCIHQIRASSLERDGIHHQHQVIYKNTSQLSTFWLLTRVAWAWRGTSPRNLLRFMLFSLPPLLCFAVFTTASVLSSRIAAPIYATSEVRIVPESCGFVAFAAPTDEEYSIQFGTPLYSQWATRKSRQATDYARNCYGRAESSAASCRVFSALKLPYSTNTTATCPFKGNRCYLGQQGALEMSTDWLDSHDHLGINAQIENRIRLRKVATCSVLNINDLISASPVRGVDVYEYYLGPRGLGKDSIGTTNSTYTWRESPRFDSIGYTMAADKAVIYDPYQSQGWVPIEDLNRTDADVSIFFLNSNGMRYFQKVLDPLFYADREFSVPLRYENITAYSSTNLTSVLACTDQYQIQNPNTNTATELTSTYKAYLQALQIGLNNAQLAAVARLGLTSYDSLMFSSVGGLSSAALHASDTTFQSLSPGLPDDQWRTEVTGWFNTSLARLQDTIISWASKDIADYEGFATLVHPTEFPELANMCKNQIVKNVGQYQSFSVLGIAVIFAVGLLIILLSWILEPIVGWWQKRFRGRSSGCEQWLLSSALQLQRLALQKENLGGHWTKCDGEVPIAEHGAKWSAGT